MKIQWKKFMICLAIPLAVGGLSALITRNNMEIYAAIQRPILAPPGWLFPIVWTVLYILMGIASYLIPTEDIHALRVYAAQLALNFFWSVIFFNLRLYLFSFIWLVLLWLLILKTVHLFSQTSKLAGNLMLPYLLWVTFAGYLNAFIYLLN